jgi:hypothetical protein
VILDTLFAIIEAVLLLATRPFIASEAYADARYERGPR